MGKIICDFLFVHKVILLYISVCSRRENENFSGMDITLYAVVD